EFKGTGNMELVLDRDLANQRIYPALDIAASGTRKEEKLLNEQQINAAHKIRRLLTTMQPAAAMKTLLEVMGKQKTNADLLAAAGAKA
ncbi:MAG: transcription termination factor Rho, partial [Tepidisphaeraceae bacterium]